MSWHPPVGKESALSDLPSGNLLHNFSLLFHNLPLSRQVPAILLCLKNRRHGVTGFALFELFTRHFLVGLTDLVKAIRDQQRGKSPHLKSRQPSSPSASRNVNLKQFTNKTPHRFFLFRQPRHDRPSWDFLSSIPRLTPYIPPEILQEEACPVWEPW